MDFDKLNQILDGQAPYRRRQAMQALFGQAVASWEQASALPEELRSALERVSPPDIRPEALLETPRAVKAALLMGKELIETVLMRHPGRNTVCLSTQAGCALACDFCLTGQGGFKRDLSDSEIIEQALFFKRYLKERREEISNVVFMGMGEPFLNYDNTVRAIKSLNAAELFNIGARKISVSTAGVPDKIVRFARDCGQCNLAWSMHAPDNRLRSKLMPINRKHPIEPVLAALRKHQSQAGRRLMVEYVMLKGVNDSPAQAQALADILKSGLEPLFMVNLIEYNQTGKYAPSPAAKIRQFKNILLRNRISAVSRYRFGDTIKAACGQLSGINKKPDPVYN